jgi:site-specific DNA recombinase
VAPIGYINNLQTHRIEIDPVRGPLITRLFELYASEKFSLKALTAKAFAVGLTHPRGNRRLYKSDTHRILQNPIYFGDFVWLEKRYEGCHEPLVTRERFDQVQAVLRRKPRARYPKQRHAFMGLLKCALCGCTMTAEKKKGKYIYYRCTGFHGACGNTYIREERLAELLGSVIQPVQITADIAEGIAKHLRASDAQAEWRRASDLRQLDQRQKISRRAASQKISGRANRRSGKGNCRLWRRNGRDWSCRGPMRPPTPKRF